ncbi:MAG: M20/M25/M40 family metallo-hydrolase [Chitinophagales bacterium]
MKKYCLFLAAFIGFGAAYGQNTANLKGVISYLASDSLHGRMTGSKDERLAADFIIKQFQQLGVTNIRGKFSTKGYLQKFKYHPKVDSTKTELVEGNNVVGFINNHAKYTVILGAHYDHLGMGDPHHSAYRGTATPHNGADDNASGVATVLELAAMVKSGGNEIKHFNYLFVLFSGEELGLYGSKWFVEHPLVDLANVNYMLNFDMVGRMDSSTHVLVVNGIGTSPVWKTVFDTTAVHIHLKTTESGVGPSDHTSFYLKNIPVLHFFTGQHKDYHMPTDDEYKINYDGMQRVLKFTYTILAQLDGKEKLPFIKTKDDNNDDAPKFTVTLGVMPDYTFEGEGMRIDGVTEGKPASKAGLVQGDVVIQLGPIEVKDMMSYMKGLSQFKKGDKTFVRIKRGKEIIQKDIQF